MENKTATPGHLPISDIWKCTIDSSWSVSQLLSDFKEDNDRCIEIYEHLVTAYFRGADRYRPESNIISIFFHELMFAFTGYFLCQQDIKRDHFPEALEPHEHELCKRFPFLRHSNNSTYEPRSEWLGTSSRTSLSMRQQLVQKLSCIRFPKGRKTIALCDPGTDIEELSWHLLSMGHAMIYPREVFIEVPDFDIQWERVAKLSSKFGIDNAYTDFIKSYLSLYIHPEATRVEWDIIVVGTLKQLRNRLLAVLTRRSGKIVIAVGHGEADGDLDIPQREFGERVFCNSYLSYGTAAGANLKSSRIIKPIAPLPIEHPVNAPLVGNIFNPTPIPKFSKITNPRIMYVPTTFSMSSRYGPFRDVSDFNYISWQRYLLRTLDISVVKVHMKNPAPYRSLTETQWQVLLCISDRCTVKIVRDENFSRCLDLADVFVFDYLSTASHIAFATNKPIVFLDFGFNNPFPNLVEALKSRCIYLDMREVGDNDLNEAIASQTTRDCVNRLSDRFSLVPGLRESRKDTLLSVIRDSANRNP